MGDPELTVGTGAHLCMTVRIPWILQEGDGQSSWGWDFLVGKGPSVLSVRTERRLQGMSCLGAPARRVDVWVVGVNPEVIGVTPAIEVELWRKGRWRSGVILDWKDQAANLTVTRLHHHIFQGHPSLSYWHLPSI